MTDPFPYAERAAAVEAARKTVDETVRRVTRRHDPADPATATWEAAVARFHAAVAVAYPPDFETIFSRLREGDPSSIESAIGFLEADPWFFRSGYVKAKLVKLIKRLPLKPEQVRRLQAVIVNVVDGRDRREFRDYCRLARYIDGLELRQSLETRLTCSDEGARRRAAWVLVALGALPK